MSKQGHFEAKKHAYHQVQKGIVVSFVIHPSDIDKDFATAPLGTMYQIGWAEIDPDTNQPAKATQETPQDDESAEEWPEIDTTAHKWPVPPPDKPKRPWSELSRAEQAGIACNDPEFQNWIGCIGPDETAKAVRARCEVVSRQFLDELVGAAHRWDELYGRYDAERRGMMG